MAGISFEMDMSALGNRITGALRRIAHTGRVTATVGEAMVAATKNRFKDAKSPAGEDWLESERAKRDDGVTLTDKAILKNSITYESGPHLVAWGTNMVYGAIHQFGGLAGRGRSVVMPKRPYLGVNNDDRDEVKSIVADFIASGMGAGGQ